MDPHARVMAVRTLTTGICGVVFDARTIRRFPALGSTDRAAPTQCCASDEHYGLRLWLIVLAGCARALATRTTVRAGQRSTWMGAYAYPLVSTMPLRLAAWAKPGVVLAVPVDALHLKLICVLVGCLAMRCAARSIVAWRVPDCYRAGDQSQTDWSSGG